MKDTTYYTWQDYVRSGDRPAMLLEAVRAYKLSGTFRTALEASAYFRGENLAVGQKTVLRAGKVDFTDENGLRRSRAVTRDVVGNRISSAFLFRFVTQQTQYLLGNGVMLEKPWMKRRLGTDFDRQLAFMGERALLHGVCWALWDRGRLEVLEAAVNPLSGFVPLRDELTGEAVAGIQFWQINAQRPLYLRLLEPKGRTLYRTEDGKALKEVWPLRPWRLRFRDMRAPLIPLYANPERRSEFTPSIKSKIDAYDNILSDFADNLDRANDVYWVLNNFGGSVEDIAQTLETINRLKAVASYSDGTGTAATAEPHTLSVPYEARQAALKLLERALYRDWMALDTEELTGGSLTNVAIRAASAGLDLKANRFEWQCFRFVRELLRLLGTDTDGIRFKREPIANQSETVKDIAAMRGDIDLKTALRLNPYLQPEEAEALAAKKEEYIQPAQQRHRLFFPARKR